MLTGISGWTGIIISSDHILYLANKNEFEPSILVKMSEQFKTSGGYWIHLYL